MPAEAEEKKFTVSTFSIAHRFPGFVRHFQKRDFKSQLRLQKDSIQTQSQIQGKWFKLFHLTCLCVVRDQQGRHYFKET